MLNKRGGEDFSYDKKGKKTIENSKKNDFLNARERRGKDLLGEKKMGQRHFCQKSEGQGVF